MKPDREEFQEGTLSAEVTFTRVSCPLLAKNLIDVGATSLLHLDFEADGSYIWVTELVAGRVQWDGFFQGFRMCVYR